MKGFNCHVINWIFLTNEEQEKFVLFEKLFPEQTESDGLKHLIRRDGVEEGTVGLHHSTVLSSVSWKLEFSGCNAVYRAATFLSFLLTPFISARASLGNC